MKHHLDIAMASDLSQQVLEMRRRLGEVSAPALDSSNRRLHPLPSQLVQRDAFIADRESTLEDLAVPTFHYRGGRKSQR